MMEGIRNWLMAVISVSVLIAAAESLMPAGSVKKVGQFVCGLVLLCVLARPLGALRGESLTEWMEEYRLTLERQEEELERQAGQTEKAVIEEYCQAYILDKAKQFGITCRVEIQCARQEEGLWLPRSVQLWGRFEPEAQSRLTELLERELGIAVSEQTYYLT